MRPTFPREHAANILQLPTKQDRQDYLRKNVPAEWHDWVKYYVKSWWPQRHLIIKNDKV